MLGMSPKRDDGTRCRYCGEKLPLLQRLSRADYCNAQHRDAYQRDQEKLAISRLQQVVTEGREAELAGQLRNSRAKAEAANWPEDPAPQEQPKQLAPPPPKASASSAPPVKGIEYDDPYEPVESGPRLCGPICTSDIAATGRITPAPLAHEPEDLGSGLRRMPESATDIHAPRMQSVEGRQLGINVPSSEGERRGKETATTSEAPLNSGMRFPALSIQSVAWTDAVERERLSWAGIPPLAGLIQIAGPQTLRFEPRLRKPMPLPEHPAGNPVRAYQPGLARGGGVPSMAGAIRGLGTWRTRFGSEGNLRAQWESDLVEMTVAASWQPRYPVFYTTSPWASDGLEQIFGLGPGRGPGEGGDGIDTSTPEGMMTLLENLGPGPGVPGGGFGPGQGGAPTVAHQGGTGDQAGTGNGTSAGLPMGGSGLGSGEGGSAGAGGGAANTRQTAAGSQSDGAPGAGPGLGAGAGPGSGPGQGAGSSGGASSITEGAFLSRLGAADASGGRGKGPGLFKGKASGNGVGDGAGSGTGDGRGVVSLEAVAALVKAARQSDRTRTPLRDIEIGLLNHAAAPRLAEPLEWRGLTEGCARGLAKRGPIWIKAPFVLPASVGEVDTRPVSPEQLSIAIPRAPLRPLALPPAVLPVLELAPEQEWNQAWLQPIEGVGGQQPVEAEHLLVQSKVLVPEHRVPAVPTGRAGQLQPTVPLPEPWIEPAIVAAELSGRLAEPEQAPPARPRIPERPADPASTSDRYLELGGLERPGTKWVLLRGSEEAATFRLSLDHLRAQEPGPPSAAEWGPVAARRPATGSAGLAPSRGFVHRDLDLQFEAAEPMLEPVMCQFGSARGGVWG